MFFFIFNSILQSYFTFNLPPYFCILTYTLNFFSFFFAHEASRIFRCVCLLTSARACLCVFMLSCFLTGSSPPAADQHRSAGLQIHIKLRVQAQEEICVHPLHHQTSFYFCLHSLRCTQKCCFTADNFLFFCFHPRIPLYLAIPSILELKDLFKFCKFIQYPFVFAAF